MKLSKLSNRRKLLDDMRDMLAKRGSISRLFLEEGLFSNGNIFACGSNEARSDHGHEQAGIELEAGASIPFDRIISLILDFLHYKPMNLCIFEGMRLSLRRALIQSRDKRIYSLNNEVCYFLSGEVSPEILLTTIKDAEYDGRFVCVLSEGIRDTYDRQSRLIKDQQMRSLVRRAKYIIVGDDGSRHGFLWSYEEPEAFARIRLE